MGLMLIGMLLGLLGGMLLTGYLFVRRILNAEKSDPFRSEDPAIQRELDHLLGCVHQHIYVNIKHRRQYAEAPATQGGDALRWLFLRDGVISFENGVATVPSGEQVDFRAVVSTLFPDASMRGRSGALEADDAVRASFAAEMAATVIDRARRAH